MRWPTLDDFVHLIRRDQRPLVSPVPRLPAALAAARRHRRLALAIRRIGRWRLRGVRGIESQAGFEVAVLGFELLDAVEQLGEQPENFRRRPRHEARIQRQPTHHAPFYRPGKALKSGRERAPNTMSYSAQTEGCCILSLARLRIDDRD